jgi:hypothetical protein
MLIDVRALKIIDKEDFLIVAGEKEISVIDINKRIIVFCMKFGFNCEFNCIYQKKNGNILITEYGDICKIKEFQFSEEYQNLNLVSSKEKDFTKYITTIAELDNGDLLVGGYDNYLIVYTKN